MGKYTGNLVNATDAAVVAWLTSHEDELDTPPPQKTETESQAPRSSPAELTPETIDKMPFSEGTKAEMLARLNDPGNGISLYGPIDLIHNVNDVLKQINTTDDSVNDSMLLTPFGPVPKNIEELPTLLDIFDWDTDIPSTRVQSEFKPVTQQAANIRNQMQEINGYFYDIPISPYPFLNDPLKTIQEFASGNRSVSPFTADQEEDIKAQMQALTEDELVYPDVFPLTIPHQTAQEKREALYDEWLGLQEQYNEIINSEAYINENWERWLLLADPATVLTEEEKKEAAVAVSILQNYTLKRDIEDDWNIYSDVDNKANYAMLTSLLEVKSSKLDALAYGAADALPLELNPLYEETMARINTRARVTETPLKSYQKMMFQNNLQYSDLSRQAYPGYYITGNVTTNLAMLALGAEALGAMGVVSTAAKSAILFGTNSALQSASSQDWSTPGQAVGDVVLDTGVGILSGYVGGKAAELAILKVGLILENSDLSVDAINFLLSGTGGFSFGVAQTGTIEVSKLVEAGITGEPYQFDAAGAAINITVSTLFATLEVLKSKYLADPTEYKLASEIENSLKNGDVDGVEKAVEFINKKAETIDLKAIEKSNAALAGGKDEGYNGSNSTLDEAIYKNWYGDEWHPPTTGGGKTFNKLPPNDSQLKHIFRNAEGHLPDTFDNRYLLESIANTQTYYLGTDKYGTQWYSWTRNNGTQVWVRSRQGTIINGGINNNPLTFDPDTGLNANPYR